MAHLNDNYLKLKAGYLFPGNRPAGEGVLRRQSRGRQAPHPLRHRRRDRAAAARRHCRPAQGGGRNGRARDVQRLRPGTGLRLAARAIAQNDFRDRGCDVADDEIFVSDGTKCDTGNILDILGHKNKIAISDPVYPVYVDTNVMAGHTGEANEAGAYAKLVYLPCRPSNGFIPEPPKRPVDVIYLCSPNNPTGAAANRPQLEAWVKYALEHKAVILFDAAYEAYITDPALPHSIYEIPGARDCAIEFRSFSKNGGFTGTRCAYTVVPKPSTRRPKPASSSRCIRSGCGARRPNSTA
jgi:LL-diaminopimelate aminotransferase